MVLRRQTFAGHTARGRSAFPGAAGAALLGVSADLRLLRLLRRRRAGDRAAAGATGARRRAREDSAVTGTVQAFALACGLLFVTPLPRLPQRPERRCCSALPGHHRPARSPSLAVVGALVLAVLAVIGRPLLFASVDPAVAAGARRPGAALSAVFLVLLGAAVAEVAQITGSPAGLRAAGDAGRHRPAAHRPTRRSGLAARGADRRWLVTWLGLVAAYFQPYPIGFFVTTFAFGGYLLAHLGAPCTTTGAGGRGRAPRAPWAGDRHEPMFASRSSSTPCWPAPGSRWPAGLVGYFLVLRAQVFTGDALCHVAFTGALAALAFGDRPAARAVRGHRRGRPAAGRRSAAAGRRRRRRSAASSPGSSASACSS